MRVAAFVRWAPVVPLLAAAATLAWVLRRPLGTFALGSLHWWSDQFPPLALGVVAAVAIWAVRAARPGLLGACLAVPPGGLVGAALVGALRFTAAKPVVWAGLVLLGALWLLVVARLVFWWKRSAAGFFLGLLLGGGHLLARLPPPAQTHPVGGRLPDTTSAGGRLERPCGAATLWLHPLLTMESTSKDGFWPGVSPPDELEGAPALEGASRRAWVGVEDGGVVALTQLAHPVASHLNRFLDVKVTGTRALRVQFEGLAERFEFPVFDYPHGRVAWFATVRAGALVVAHGSDAEKGPFVRVASAPLSADGALRLRFFDGEQPLCELQVLDFVAQADSVNESPTAGEGLPPNVIQFGVPARGDGQPVLHFSLAETGVGAGRDTVLHAAGTYRNRLRLVPADAW